MCVCVLDGEHSCLVRLMGSKAYALVVHKLSFIALRGNKDHFHKQWCGCSLSMVQAFQKIVAPDRIPPNHPMIVANEC